MLSCNQTGHGPVLDQIESSVRNKKIFIFNTHWLVSLSSGVRCTVLTLFNSDTCTDHFGNTIYKTCILAAASLYVMSKCTVALFSQS